MSSPKQPFSTPAVLATSTAGPIRLTPADEASAVKEASANLRNGALKDWPNEAGFTNLDEHRGPIELKVVGEIPAWAYGSLYRTGPGVSEIETEAAKGGMFRFSHWFDGLAHTHRFEIVASGAEADGENVGTNGDGEGIGAKAADGVRVFYSSRRQSDRMMEHIKANGTLRSTSFGQKADPCVGILGKFMSVFRRRDQDLINVAVTVQPELNLVTAKKKGSGAATNTNTNGEKTSAANTASDGKPPAAELGHRGQAKTLYLATDAAVFSRIDPSTLEPLGYVHQTELHPDLKGPTSAAHGKRDPVNGDFFNFNLELGRTPTYRVFQVVAATGEVKILATIRGRGVHPGYIHSFFLTERYVILCVNSVHFPLGGAKIPLMGNLLEGMRFEPKQPCKWYVVDRRGGKGVVGEFSSPPGFFFHSTNAFEDGETGDVVCEMVEYANADLIYSLYYDVVMNRDGKGEAYWKEKDPKGRLCRYRLPMGLGDKEGKVRSDEVIGPSMAIPAPYAGELPTYNTAYMLREHRYTYAVSSRGLSTMFDSIVKTDTATQEALMWCGPKGHTPGEAIFVPRPAGEDGGERAEDDGVLLSVVLDGESRVSYLLCLDARTMEEVGRAECGFAVGFGFHGRLARG
ncbi:related to beta-carotene 15,15`-dioxygenase [Cephalotrichum gorgonifer]|uniref:Related to beta-carotene 15,15`-dioxygenase n=1 Tax=Cephalotrichum gorgonifer TaxID=2041049 RepID=A0AAE8SZS2_9PEZI|nr:related to beta-carotene 15,15`-dioxygenase [Cephalotrichum gorgonifer]